MSLEIEVPGAVPSASGNAFRKIAVVGSTGSGKTTMARALAARLGVPHVELDELHWEAGWVEAPAEVFRERVAAALDRSAWVVDGNYSIVRDIVWSQAGMLVWLDYSLLVIMGRLARRTVTRVVRRTELWNGNRESLRTALLSRDSIFLWALTTYRKLRKNYPQLFSSPEHAHLRIVHLKSPRAARRWLDGVQPIGAGSESWDM
jgi:adenylate kinase family enzyme